MTFVELLDRRGRVRARVRVGALPFRIGRGYDCDLILDDPHVSALHAVLESDAEGRLVLRDVGSRNGLFLDGGRDRVSRVTLSGDVTVRMGRTSLRLRAAGFVVPEAIPIAPRSPLVEWMLEHWTATLVIAGLWMGVLVLDEYRATTMPFEPIETLSTTAWSLLAYGVWIGGWALLNRLLRQRTRFVAHATVALAFSILYTLVQWGFEWLRFLIPSVEPLRLADQVVTTAIWSLVLLGHLTVMGVAQRRLRLAIVAVGFGAILGLQLLDHYNDDMDWVTTLPYWSRLEPIDPAWLPVESADDFFAGVPALAAELEALASEAQEDEGDDTAAPAEGESDAAVGRPTDPELPG